MRLKAKTYIRHSGKKYSPNDIIEVDAQEANAADTLVKNGRVEPPKDVTKGEAEAILKSRGKPVAGKKSDILIKVSEDWPVSLVVESGDDKKNKEDGDDTDN